MWNKEKLWQFGPESRVPFDGSDGVVVIVGYAIYCGLQPLKGGSKRPTLRGNIRWPSTDEL